MCFFSPKVETSPGFVAPAKKVASTVKQTTEPAKKVQTGQEVKEIKVGDEARQAADVKRQGAEDLAINLPKKKETGGIGGIPFA